MALHAKLGAHTNRTNAIIRKAEQLGLIERILSERPGPGQFAPIHNRITERGKQVLQTMRL